MPTTASTTPMRAVVQDGYGTADVLRAEQVAQPTIRDHEVRVRVHAAGLNRGTWHVMSGTPYALRLAFGLRRPRQPVIGNELAGTVVDVGAEVTRFSPGDEVYGIASGTFADYAVAREDKLARQARHPHLRTGRHRPDLGTDRTPGPDRHRSRPVRPAGARHRRVGRSRRPSPCRSPRRSART